MIDPLALSGRELLQAGMDGHLPPATIAATLNFRLVEIGDGTAVFEGEPGPAHLNPLGSVHGGWALTLIDSACGCAAHSTLGAGVGYTTVETKVNFTRAIRSDDGVLRTEGTGRGAGAHDYHRRGTHRRSRRAAGRARHVDADGAPRALSLTVGP
jgi:uncharacterized protein (TIGR00369 family)